MAVLSSRCPPRCPLLMHLPLSSSPPDVLLAVLSSCASRCPQTSLPPQSQLSATPAVRSSRCPLPLLSAPPMNKQKHARHCSSTFHLTPSFNFYTIPLSSSDRFCPSFLVCLTDQRRHFIKKDAGIVLSPCPRRTDSNRPF